jgi:hypothetical protein
VAEGECEAGGEGGAGVGAGEQAKGFEKVKQASGSFLKKRTKKLLNALRGRELFRPPAYNHQRIKVFWFFFSKKNRFLSLP